MRNEADLPVYAVVLAGGAGTRLWPMARPERPKQFLTLFGGRSLFQRTVDRATAVAGRGRTVVVAGLRHAPLVRAQAPWVTRDRTILEGEGRNTAASVALAARWARERHGDAVLVVMPADHWIDSRAGFVDTVRTAIAAARRPDVLATIGVPATAPETGFGYIRPAAPAGSAAVRPVAGFVEKPALPAARRMVGSGRYLWNSGLFVWRASAILAALAEHAPRLARAAEHAVLRRRPAGWVCARAEMVRIPAAPIDTAVLEKAANVVVARARFEWSDLGDWSAIDRLLTTQRWGRDAAGRTLAIGARRCAAINPGGVTVFVGVADLVAVRAGDAVLVCRRDAAQRVREIPEAVRA
jgi:mannose-1-phosphate guanylyltransferase/mannose-6-phosphate isomerase